MGMGYPRIRLPRIVATAARSDVRILGTGKIGGAPPVQVPAQFLVKQRLQVPPGGHLRHPRPSTQ
jgi:hypothetical protein